MTQSEPPGGPSGEVEPTAGPPSGGPPTDPQSEGRAPAAQPAWPDAAAGAPSGTTAAGQAEEMAPLPGTPGAPEATSPGSAPGSTPDSGWTPTGLTPTNGWSTAPPARPARRFGLLPRVIVPGIVVLVLVGGFLLRDRLTGNVGELKPGDCFDDPITAGQGAAEVKDVQHRPCSEPHLFEVVDTFKFPSGSDAAFPGHDAFAPFVIEKCSAAFVGYVGIPEEQSSLTYLAYTPVESGWKSGDRDVTCLLGTVDGSTLTGSMKNARR